MSEVVKREGVELVAYTEFRIVSMFVFEGHLIVATERGIYRYEHQAFHPIKFHNEDPI